MRTTQLRVAAALSGLVVFAVMGGAQGATVTATGPKTLTITDPAGDAVGGQAAFDITSVVVTTTGKTVSKKVKGKTIKSYTPDTFVVRMNMSGPVSSLPIALYEVTAVTSECGNLWLYYDGQDLFSGGQVACGEDVDTTGDPTTSFDPPVVSGNTITWSMPLAKLPKREMRIGTSITDFHAYVAIGEPFQGLSTEFVGGPLNPDNADSGAVYKIG